MAQQTVGGALFGQGAAGSGLGGLGSVGPTTAGTTGYGPVGHGTAEQWPRGQSRFMRADTRFGLTPPGSRSGTPLPTRTSRSDSSRRRSRAEDRDSPGEKRNRSRENRSPRSQQGDAEQDEEQPLPTGWGARMLATERKLVQQEEQIKNLKAIVEGAHATITQRVEKHESKIIEVDGRVNDIETKVPERLFKTEERQDLYIRMLNELTSNISVNFDQLSRRIQQFETRSPNFGAQASAQPTIVPTFGMPQTTTTETGPRFGSAPIPPQTAAGGGAQTFDIGSPLGPNAQTSSVPSSWAR